MEKQEAQVPGKGRNFKEQRPRAWLYRATSTRAPKRERGKAGFYSGPWFWSCRALASEAEEWGTEHGRGWERYGEGRPEDPREQL